MSPLCSRRARWRADFMRVSQRLRRTACVLGAMSAGFGSAAEHRHDLYFCVNLSGQGQVMGSTAPIASGLYRSNDRQNFEHVGFGHIRTFALTHDPRDPTTLFVSLLDGILRT